MSRAVKFDHYGDRSVLYITEVEVPSPSAGEVVVHVRAAAINPGEVSIRVGALEKAFPATFPSGEGSDLAGVVDRGWPGRDRVRRRGRGSRLVVGALQSSRVRGGPRHTVDQKALESELGGRRALLYVIGCTAYTAVRAVAPREGETVVVSAAAGGVGTGRGATVRLKGATVLGIASEHNHDWLHTHGVIPVAYGQGLAGRLSALAPNGIDAFIDLFGPQYVELAVELGVRRADRDDHLSRQGAGSRGQGGGERGCLDHSGSFGDGQARGRRADRGCPVATTYPLERVQDAFAELEKRHTHVFIP